jgi:PP-loop superfamily ATP-utilizing enzyme
MWNFTIRDGKIVQQAEGELDNPSSKINIDISQYHQVVAFLKRKSEGYRPKKSCIFCKEKIHQFLKEMNDKDFLFMKVNWS